MNQFRKIDATLRLVILLVATVAVISVIGVVLAGVFFGVDQSAIKELQNRNVTSIVGPSGATGAPGATNATGGTGAPGVSGVTGMSGVSGISGTSGISGASGGTGFSGASGRTGSSGASGRSGFTGATGVSGAQGEAGPPGPEGTSPGAFRTAVLGIVSPITEAESGTVQTDLIGTGRNDMYALGIFPSNVLLTSVDVYGVIGGSWDQGNLIVTLHYDSGERAFATSEVLKAGDYTVIRVADLRTFAKELAFTEREIVVPQGVPFLARIQIEAAICTDLRLAVTVNAAQGPVGFLAGLFSFNDTNITDFQNNDTNITDFQNFTG